MDPFRQKLVMGAAIALMVAVLAIFYEKKPAVTQSLPGDGIVLARVNGTPISKYDVELAVKITFGKGRENQGVSRETMLESMVQTRAIADVAEGELTKLEKDELAKQVAMHRDQLLVQRYLAKHAQPHLVDDVMVRKYYDENPERFGAETVRTYELVGAERALTPSERTTVVEKLGSAARRDDWAQWAGELRRDGLPMTHRAGDLLPKVVHPRLYELMQGMPLQRASQTVFVEERAYVVKVTGEKKKHPRPFVEVQEEIRRSLRPIQVKDAVSRAAAEVLPGAKVEYTREAGRESSMKPASGKEAGRDPLTKEKVATQR